MTYSDFLLFYARKGLINNFRKSAFRKFCRRNTGRKITANTNYGFKMNTIIGDSVDNRIAIYGVMEPSTTYVIKTLSSHCDSFIDVGCNIGYYSALFGSINPKKPLISIDPNPKMIERCEDNLNLNQCQGYELLSCGIGESNGILELNIPEKRHSLSSFAYTPERGGPSDTIKCEIHPLSDIILERKITNCFVKVDTEGFEYEVFSGLTEEAAKHIKCVLFELATSNLKQAGRTPSEIFNLPIMKNFDIYLVQEEQGGCIEKIDPATLPADKKLNLDVLLVSNDTETGRLFEQAGIRIKE